MRRSCPGGGGGGRNIKRPRDVRELSFLRNGKQDMDWEWPCARALGGTRKSCFILQTARDPGKVMSNEISFPCC